MSNLNELSTIEEWEEAKGHSTEEPILVFKHSTTCPVSAGAFNQFQAFLDTKDDSVDCYFLKVRESREVSNQIAEDMEVQHKSPQILLIRDQEVIWHTSHDKITKESIEEAI